MINIPMNLHSLIILDESGSMEPIKESVISGFDVIVKTIKDIRKIYPNQFQYISLVAFNSDSIRILKWKEDVDSYKCFKTMGYRPQGGTPLYDAIGFALNRMKTDTGTSKTERVWATIFTDGEDNTSAKFDLMSIKKMIDELKAVGWTFSYIGTDHEVNRVANSISVDNIMSFKKNSFELKNLFQMEKEARLNYSKRLDEFGNMKGPVYNISDKDLLDC